MKRTKGISPPSNRDTIESWLDVLVSMLNLPPSQRTQVRDELEDHLRSRVDDLLIMGKPEPDAIQTAIHELGETAELAKLISSASRTRTPFRRFAMNATFFVLAGSIMTASISMMMPTSTHNASNTMISHSEETVPVTVTDADPFESFTIDVRNATFGELFDQIEEHADRPLIIHWDMLEEFGFSSDTPINIDSNPINARLVFTILAERTEQVFYNSMAAFERPDRIEIGNRDQFDRRTTVKKVYDLSVFAQPHLQDSSNSGQSSRMAAYTQNTVQRVMDLVQSHVSSRDWTSMGGSLATSSVLNSTLIVTAPERMHEEIRVLLDE
ncbi:MAG: permease prefix domain 1-containing protein, partial [Phycisphaerales bacterium]